ncbi:MAG TPA: hypothetical protein VGX97_02420 [bacterium]|nr:hypothetical protein [bacterium]
MTWRGGAAAGFVTAGLLVAAVLVVPGPARLGRSLYDGVSPMPPYQWAHPPRELARDNRPAEPGRTTRDLDPEGRSPGAVATGDAQCTVIFNDGAIAAGPLGGTITVTVTPLDPASLAPPPPGTRFDGNACRFEAVYGKSGVAPRYRRPITVVLRYATGGTQIVRATAAGPPRWEPIRAVQYGGHLQLLVADVTALGTFAPVAPAGTPYVSRTSWARVAVVAAGALFVVLVLLRRPWRRPRRA